MSRLAEEIQKISECPDRCVDYPIGTKLQEFVREQMMLEYPNFNLTGVVIHWSAKIYGRNVDYLMQETIGLSENVSNASSNENKQEKKEGKKTRTKKYVIKDGVNMDRTSFDESSINVATRNDINKTLASPSKITRLQQIKEFHAKNNAKSGKLGIPKSLLLSDDACQSNFGTTQIVDYEDDRDIVGSRRDFTSFSNYINGCTGELQNDMHDSSKQSQINDEYFTEEALRDTNVSAPFSPELQLSPSPATLSPQSPDENVPEVSDLAEKLLENSINIEDEGIDVEELQQPVIRITDILRESPQLFNEIQLHESFEMNFQRSIISVRESLNKIEDFRLPTALRNEVNENRMKNIFMVPLQKLKHKRIFKLPDDEEFRELKRRRMNCHKSLPPEAAITQTRITDFFEPQKSDISENIPILSESGSTPLNESEPLMDSGFDSLCINTSQETSLSHVENSTDNMSHETLSENNITGADSCYQSLASGQSLDGPTKLSINLEDFSTPNSTTVEEAELDLAREQQAQLESEETIQQMKQSALNITKWKEFLKPILAESEKRSKIDMHEYQVLVINKIGNIGDTKTLGEIIETGSTPAYFLTMLQLTNNHNINLSFNKRSINEPTSINDIKLTLKSKVVHKEKFDEMGQHFEAEEIKKHVSLKRKAIQTSTPAKKSLLANESIDFLTPTCSSFRESRFLSQASSGYFSQTSLSDDI